MSELNAIKTVFPESSVSICKGHILRDLIEKAKSIFNNEVTQKEAVHKLETVLNSTQEEAAQKLHELKEQFVDYPNWFDYFTYYKTLLPYLINDADTSFSTTNNYESWYSTIESKFIKSIRKHTPDDLLCVLYKEVIPFYTTQHDDYYVRGKRFHLNEAERDAAYSFSDEDIKTLVELQDRTGLVKSSRDNNLPYTVTIEHGQVTCTCNTERDDRTWCKHLYMYHRKRLLVFGDAIAEDPQDYLSDESEYDDGSFSDTELDNDYQNKQDGEVHHDDGFDFSNYEDSLDVVDPTTLTSSTEAMTIQSDQSTTPANIPQKFLEELDKELRGYMKCISENFEEVYKNLPEKVNEFVHISKCFKEHAESLTTGEQDLAHNRKRRKKKSN